MRIFSAGLPGVLSSMTLALGSLFPLLLLSQTHSGFPVDIMVGPSPQPVMANGHIHLPYKLHLTNFASLPIELTRVEVWADGSSPLPSYEAKVLQDMAIPIEELSSSSSPAEAKGGRTIGEGHEVMIFFDLALDAAARVPHELRHRYFSRLRGRISPTTKPPSTVRR